ncbi:glycosyltransferase [Bacillus songklensis]|uniref:Glycosyltransferase n=1 Tax=Bacillus songklensis TaxID=1069116 RepID=A0ABV8B4K4_9BACI
MVSIVMTSYNKPDTVGEAIQSVLDQTYTNWELFIMDDASNAKTQKVIEKYLEDPRIRFYNSYVKDEERYKKTRYAVLINKALPLTQGKYISYLTDDNFYLRNRLEVMVDYFWEHSDIDIVYSAQRVKNVDTELDIVSEFIRKTNGILTKASNLVDHCSVMHTRSIAEKIYRKYGSYWDEDAKYWHNGDAAFWKRLNEWEPFYPIDKVLDVCLKNEVSFQKLNIHLPDHLPDGILVTGVDTDIYFIDRQKRRKIDHNMLRKLKLDRRKIIRIHNPLLFKYREGPPINETIYTDVSLFPNLLLVKDTHTRAVYYIQDQKKRLIKNEATLNKFHFNMKEIIHCDRDFLNQWQDGEPITDRITDKVLLPDRILFNKRDKYYLSCNNHLHPIEKRIVGRLGFSYNQAVSITNEQISFFEQGKPYVWEVALF